jgi:hypothetical protein
MITTEENIKTLAEFLLTMEAHHQFECTREISEKEIFSHHVKKMVMSHCIKVVKQERKRLMPNISKIEVYEEVFWYIADVL